MPHKETISILGCGWLGLALAKSLRQQHYSVKGSITRTEKKNVLEELGIDPYVFALRPQCQETDLLKSFLSCEVLIIAIPPQVSTYGEAFHPAQIQFVIDQLQEHKFSPAILYISSTSIYLPTNKEVTEEELLTSTHNGNAALFASEHLLRNFQAEVSILRMGGLTGADRMLIRHFAGKKGLRNGAEPVNMIHQQDAVEIIVEIIRQQRWGKTYNACAPLHPLKKDFYMDQAQRLGFNAPEFLEVEPPPYKIVSHSKLIQELNYTFRFPDPMTFSYQK